MSYLYIGERESGQVRQRNVGDGVHLGGKANCRHGQDWATKNPPGLPYTVLLDREGKIVQRWVGYSGPDQMPQIRAAIHLELGRASAGHHAHH
jgi:hypothetical protein